ncbi:MAG TPA: lysozyme inhibitor LprI family protein [Phenylobacterium sp.]|nr:lysozyme inhibitor LprI family protein [Phenylobacterium sp.]
MTTDPAGQPWDGTTYRGFSGPAPEVAPPSRRPRAWPMSRTVAVGVGGAVVLGLLLGVWAKPNLGRSGPAAPMRAVTATEDNTPARMDIEVNAVPPPPIVKSAGRLDVLPPGAAQAASRPAPFLAGLPAEPPQSVPASPRPVQVGDPAPLAAPQIAATDGCQAARGRAAQMVCADPDLSAADRELNQAYRRALRAGVSPDQLRQEQRDWLAIREDAASRSPRAVASVYDQRIDELNQIADEGPG